MTKAQRRSRAGSWHYEKILDLIRLGIFLYCLLTPAERPYWVDDHNGAVRRRRDLYRHNYQLPGPT